MVIAFFVWEKIHLRLVEDLRFFAKHFVIFARNDILKFKALGVYHKPWGFCV